MRVPSFTWQNRECFLITVNKHNTQGFLESTLEYYFLEFYKKNN